jgi:hypothetical protein
MAFMRFVPLLVFVVIGYNILAFFGEDAPDTQLFGIDLPSGGTMKVTWNTILLTAAIVLSLLEVFKATRISRQAVVDHGVSLVLFIICLIEFLLVAPLANSGFFILMLLTGLDVVAGFAVSLSTARRDIAVGPGYHTE